MYLCTRRGRSKNGSVWKLCNTVDSHYNNSFGLVKLLCYNNILFDKSLKKNSIQQNCGHWYWRKILCYNKSLLVFDIWRVNCSSVMCDYFSIPLLNLEQKFNTKSFTLIFGNIKLKNYHIFLLAERTNASWKRNMACMELKPKIPLVA